MDIAITYFENGFSTGLVESMGRYYVETSDGWDADAYWSGDNLQEAWAEYDRQIAAFNA